MKPLALALALVALFLAGCATRSTPCDVIRSAGDSMAQGVDQSNRQFDLVPGVAVADTSANAVAAPTTGAVETQTNNSATSPQLQVHDLFGFERQAANIISSTSPAEAATIRRLAKVEERLSIVEDAIDAGVAPNLPQLEFQAKALGEERDKLIAALERYAAEKIAAARELAPQISLPNLERIVAFVVNQQQVGTDKQLTDAQAQATAEAMKSVYGRDTTPATNNPNPNP